MLQFSKMIEGTGITITNSPFGSGIVVLLGRGDPAVGYMQAFTANTDPRVDLSDIELHLKTAETIYAAQFKALFAFASLFQNSVFSRDDNERAAAAKENVVAIFGNYLVQQIARSANAIALAQA